MTSVRATKEPDAHATQAFSASGAPPASRSTRADKPSQPQSPSSPSPFVVAPQVAQADLSESATSSHSEHAIEAQDPSVVPARQFRHHVSSVGTRATLVVQRRTNQRERASSPPRRRDFGRRPRYTSPTRPSPRSAARSRIAARSRARQSPCRRAPAPRRSFRRRRRPSTRRILIKQTRSTASRGTARPRGAPRGGLLEARRRGSGRRAAVARGRGPYFGSSIFKGSSTEVSGAAARKRGSTARALPV